MLFTAFFMVLVLFFFFFLLLPLVFASIEAGLNKPGTSTVVV